MSQSVNGYTGSQNLNDTSSQFNAVEFIARQVLNKACTATLVRVMAVTTAGGVGPVGYVDVQPLVNQIDGAGNKMPHGTVYNLPYLRLQGGTNAIILDPAVGDIGLASIASHDISAIKTTKDIANPGSRRRFNMADGIYSGGVLNGAPTQYVQFNAEGISVVSPAKVTIQAPTINLLGNIVSSNPDGSANTMGFTGLMTINGPIVTTGTIINNGKSIGSPHTHGGVQTGGGTTGVVT